jgi:LIVCS family branched-chain amino acid:cation transporter
LDLLFLPCFLAQESYFTSFIGLKSGTEWFYAIVGFITTGIIAPLISLMP